VSFERDPTSNANRHFTDTGNHCCPKLNTVLGVIWGVLFQKCGFGRFLVSRSTCSLSGTSRIRITATHERSEKSSADHDDSPLLRARKRLRSRTRVSPLSLRG
jgi:hypothetical protein